MGDREGGEEEGGERDLDGRVVSSKSLARMRLYGGRPLLSRTRVGGGGRLHLLQATAEGGARVFRLRPLAF